VRALPVTLLAVVCALASWDAAPGGTQRLTATASKAAPDDDTDAVIRISAVVRNSRGELLTGLKPADFELLVDGAPQPVETAELSKGITTARAFVILLDEFHTSAADSAAVRDGLLQFVDRSLRAEDLAVVVKPLDPLTDIRPSADRDALRTAIATFEGRKGDYAPRTAFERNYMAQAPAAVESARGQIVTSALRAMGAALSATRDVRGVIVLVSDGFARMRSGRDVPANLQTAVRIANRADAPVYAFAPALSSPPADGSAPGDPAFVALRALAADTGGELVTGAGAIVPGLARMTHDLDTHYVLTYRAAHGSDGRFHTLELTVKRPGAQVRARTGYVAPISAALRAALNPAPSAPLRVLRRSSLIQTWAGIVPLQDGQVQVTVTWEPAKARGTSGARARPERIVLTASTSAGTLLFDGPIGPASDPSSTELPDRARFEAPPGPVTIDMKLLDAKGVVLDTDARDIAVPERKKHSAIVYPAAVIRTRSAREFRAAVGDEVAPTATRDFWRTDRLLVRAAALDPAGRPTGVTAVLLNRWRQQMRDVPALDTGDPAAGITLFDLPLAALAPGEYTLRLTVPGPAGAFAVEHVTFRVQG
jgi:VWFA-related protein